MRAGKFGGLDDGLDRQGGIGQRDVVADRTREQRVLLGVRRGLRAVIRSAPCNPSTNFFSYAASASSALMYVSLTVGMVIVLESQLINIIPNCLGNVPALCGIQPELPITSGAFPSEIPRVWINHPPFAS